MTGYKGGLGAVRLEFRPPRAGIPGWRSAQEQGTGRKRVHNRAGNSLSPGRPTNLENWILTKHRLMLSAAAAALLAGPCFWRVRALTPKSTAPTKNALATSTAGNITIDSGGAVTIKSSSPVITINSNNSFTNNGTVSNSDSDTAVGVLIDTSGGNLVAPATFNNSGAIDLSGKGANKTAIEILGGNIYYGSIALLSTTTISTTASGQSTASTGGSSISVQGDGSTAFLLTQGTTLDGDLTLSGPISMIPADKSTASGATLIDLEGNVNGNVFVNSGSVLLDTGSGSRGLVILGPVNACDTAGLTSVGRPAAPPASAPSSTTAPSRLPAPSPPTSRAAIWKAVRRS